MRRELPAIQLALMKALETHALAKNILMLYYMHHTGNLFKRSFPDLFNLKTHHILSPVREAFAYCYALT